MGITNSKSVKSQLENIENEIVQIDLFKESATIKEKNYVFFLWFLFIILYPSGISYIYIIFDRDDKLIVSLSAVFIVLLPILAYIIHRFIYVYFSWLKENKDIKRRILMKTKKNLLEKVQETETFNDAKTILEKYDPSMLRNLSFSTGNLNLLSNEITKQTPRRYLPGNGQSPQLPKPPTHTNAPNPLNFTQPQLRLPQSPSTASQMRVGGRTIRPILTQNRSILEKLIDYVFNDGPNNRFALICSNCCAHNGMAHPDEFDYMSYICAYCGTLNLARKSRPTAPRMDFLKKAIEPPPTPTPNDSSDLNDTNKLKIVEMSTELNKSTHESPKIEEPDDHDTQGKHKQSQNPNPDDRDRSLSRSRSNSPARARSLSETTITTNMTTPLKLSTMEETVQPVTPN